MLFSLLIATAMVTNAFGGQKCPVDWQHFEDDNSCLKAFPDKKTYYDARETCRGAGGDLVIPDSLRKNDFVRSLSDIQGNAIWIGVYDKLHDQNWTYIDGSPLRFNNWAQDKGQPNNWMMGEACGVIFHTWDGKWFDTSCVNEFKFVCQLSENEEPKPKPNNCPADWQHFQDDNSCLKAFPDKKPYYDARETCRGAGGDLVIVDSLRKNDFVRSLFDIDFSIWIGVYDKLHDQNWTYIDGSPLRYNNWAEENDQPNNWNQEEACGLIWINRDGKWNDGSCAKEFNFVCQLSENEEPKPKPNNCPADWQHFEDDNSCLKAFPDKKPYYDARETCRGAGGDLVIVDSLRKNDFVRSLFDIDFSIWIGVYDKLHDQNWTYIDGSPLRFKNWAEENAQPNNWNQEEACGLIWINRDGKWNDASCAKEFNFVCQLSENEEPKPKPNNCPADWQHFQDDNSCLKAFPDKKPYYDARETCRGAGGDLVLIDSLGKNFFVRSLFDADDSIWIGVYDKLHDQNWTYIDGSPLRFKNWAEENAQPNNWNQEEACGLIWINRDGKWNDGSCAKEFNFVCQLSENEEPKPKPNNCPADWQHFQDDNSCLKAFPDKKPYYDARETCRGAGGDLVLIDSVGKIFFVRSLFDADDNIWIGVIDKLPDQNKTYIDGSPMRYNNWAEENDQPNNWNQEEACGLIWFNRDEKSNDASCDKEFNFVCQLSENEVQPKPVMPSASCDDYGWVTNEEAGVCIKVFDDKKLTFDGARKECQAMGGDLVTMISNKKQIKFLRNYMRFKTMYWIGIHAPGKDGIYNYIDGSSLGSKRPFGRRQPSKKPKRHCMGMRRGKWYNRKCGKKYNFICQFELIEN